MMVLTPIVGVQRALAKKLPSNYVWIQKGRICILDISKDVWLYSPHLDFLVSNVAVQQMNINIFLNWIKFWIVKIIIIE